MSWGRPVFRVDTNAILSPRGDHAGNKPLTSRPVSPLPSALTIWIWKPIKGSTRLMNAILLPSGDHVGQPSPYPGGSSFLGLLPSAFISQIPSPAPLTCGPDHD